MIQKTIVEENSEEYDNKVNQLLEEGWHLSYCTVLKKNGEGIVFVAVLNK